MYYLLLLIRAKRNFWKKKLSVTPELNFEKNSQNFLTFPISFHGDKIQGLNFGLINFYLREIW